MCFIYLFIFTCFRNKNICKGTVNRRDIIFFNKMKHTLNKIDHIARKGAYEIELWTLGYFLIREIDSDVKIRFPEGMDSFKCIVKLKKHLSYRFSIK